jgi:prevent-host-death family protein
LAVKCAERSRDGCRWRGHRWFGDSAPVGHVLPLCVMSPEKRRPERVGVRELRQNLSVYLKHVHEEGRAYEVTERGEPVAHLTPLPDRPRSTYERMLAEGRITPAERPWDELPKPLPPLPGKQLSEVLQEMRDEETW